MYVCIGTHTYTYRPLLLHHPQGQAAVALVAPSVGEPLDQPGSIRLGSIRSVDRIRKYPIREYPIVYYQISEYPIGGI
jgi:hypothetical protein